MNHIFAAQTRQGTLRIFEVAQGNFAKLQAMKSLVDELTPNLRHDQARLDALARGDVSELKHKAPHNWLIEIDGVPAGLISFTYLEKANVGIAHNLAIRSRHRQFNFGSFRRMSEFLVYLAMQQLLSDASSLVSSDPVGLLVEAESSATTRDPQTQRRRDHLFNRYEEYGLIELPVSYHAPRDLVRTDIEPIIGQERPGFRPMRLGIFPHVPTAEILAPESLGRLLVAFLWHHYGLDQQHWAVMHGIASIVPESVEGNTIVSPKFEGAVLP